MPIEWRLSLDLLKSEFATIEESVQSLAEQAANPRDDRAARRAALEVAKKMIVKLNERIASLDLQLN
jgi:hypothetical protein